MWIKITFDIFIHIRINTGLTVNHLGTEGLEPSRLSLSNGF
jgi:hypothetical protein